MEERKRLTVKEHVLVVPSFIEACDTYGDMLRYYAETPPSQVVKSTTAHKVDAPTHRSSFNQHTTPHQPNPTK